MAARTMVAAGQSPPGLGRGLEAQVVAHSMVVAEQGRRCWGRGLGAHRGTTRGQGRVKDPGVWPAAGAHRAAVQGRQGQVYAHHRPCHGLAKVLAGCSPVE